MVTFRNSVLAAGLLFMSAAGAQGDPVTQAIDATVQANRGSAQSQQKVNQLDEQTRALLERYRAALWQSQQLKVYAQQLEELLASQGNEKDSLARQIAEMDRVEAELMPLMLRMLDSLEKFVAMDLPFLADERSERIANLKRLMADPEAGLSEKYRRIMEAYQIEVDYGRGLGTERAEVEGRIYDLLRVGRSALFALALDGAEALRWDPQAGLWAELDGEYVASIKRGLRIARELASADLMVLPMPAAQRVAP